MDDVCTYQIEVQGQVEEKELNAMSPLRITEVRVGQTATLLVVRSDQSGLVGLIRHLHRWGYVLLSVTREDRTFIQEEL